MGFLGMVLAWSINLVTEMDRVCISLIAVCLSTLVCGVCFPYRDFYVLDNQRYEMIHC